MRRKSDGERESAAGTHSVSVSVRVSSESASLSLESGRPETHTNICTAITVRTSSFTMNCRTADPDLGGFSK